VVLVSPGLGEHGGRYETLALSLRDRAIETSALDHRGHGRSSGARGHAPRFRSLVDDLEAFRCAATAEVPGGTPVFLLGHSMGALVAIRHLQEHPAVAWAGVILSAPLLRSLVAAPRWKTALSGLLSRIAPSLPFDSGIPIEDLSSAPGYADAYRADPLLHRTITPRLYAELGPAMLAAARGPGAAVDVLVLAPGADRVVDPAAVRAWSDAAGADLRWYEGYRHEPLNETGRERVVGDVVAWIEDRLPAAAGMAGEGGTSLAR
jgi:alpha-beta hydrolase superfamily lysophospholipase